MNEEQLDEFKKGSLKFSDRIKKDVIDLTNKKRKVNIK